MKILIIGEFSGRIRDAFIKEGHEAVSCDLIASETTGPHYQGDYRDIVDAPWDMVIGHPPCTDTAVSGAKHFEEKKNDGRHYRGIAFFMEMVRRTTHIPLRCFEHPISVISSWYRKPDQIIQPYQFGHGETKATCLWLDNLPLLMPTQEVEGREERIWKEPPSPERWKNRSRTFPGIAEAMAKQWGKTEEH